MNAVVSAGQLRNLGIWLKQGWWLRSPGNNSNNAAVVNNDGDINANGNKVNNDNVGVRPDLFPIA